MAILSDDEARRVEEVMAGATLPVFIPSIPIDPISAEVWVNGDLRLPGADYSFVGDRLEFVEALEAGDTLRVSGLPSEPSS